MNDSISRPDFLLRDLWRWLQVIEICIHELQESMLFAAKFHTDMEADDYILSGTCFVSSLEGKRIRLQQEIVAAARNFCTDSEDEEDLVDLFAWSSSHKETFQKFISSLQLLISESKSCVNGLRMFYEGHYNEGIKDNSTTMRSKGGKWVRTYQGNDLEDLKRNEKTTFGILKNNFDKQTANILILEEERNEMSVHIERLRAKLQNCVCRGGLSRKKSKKA